MTIIIRQDDSLVLFVSITTKIFHFKINGMKILMFSSLIGYMMCVNLSFIIKQCVFKHLLYVKISALSRLQKSFQGSLYLNICFVFN